MANENQNQNQIKIELPKEELQGRYANMAMIAHGPNDFFIDMILRGPNMPQARVQSRIIMAPQHAKELMFALQENIRRYESLQENIRRYESNFGEIKINRPAGNGNIMDFPLPKGQA